MTVEQFKLVMTHNFKNINNRNANEFLDTVVQHDGYGLYRENGIDYKLIRVDEFGIDVRINTLYDANKKAYREIVFIDRVEDAGNVFVLEKNKSYQGARYTSRYTIEDAAIVFSVESVEYFVDEKYKLSDNAKRKTWKQYFDFKNMSTRYEPHDAKAVIENYFGISYTEDSYKERDIWNDKVDEAIRNNLDFAKIADEFKIRQIGTLAQHPKQVMMAFAHCIACPFMKNFLKSEYMIENYLGDTYLYKSPKELIASAKYRAGDTVAEIMGFPECYRKFVDETLTSDAYRFQYHQLVALRESIEGVDKMLNIVTQEEAEMFIRLTMSEFGYFDILSVVPKIVYLRKVGYSIKEIFDYLAMVDKKQAIPVKEGFELFYNTVIQRESLTGKLHKFFPKYLRVTSNVFTRDLHNMVVEALEEKNDKLLSNYFERKKHYEYKGDEFEIVVGTNVAINRSTIITAINKNDEIMFYKKKRGSKYVAINISGNTLVSTSEKLKDAHRANLKKWAEDNDIVIAYPYQFE